MPLCASSSYLWCLATPGPVTRKYLIWLRRIGKIINGVVVFSRTSALGAPVTSCVKARVGLIASTRRRMLKSPSVLMSPTGRHLGCPILLLARIG